MIHVIILAGGNSSERAVSLRSGAAVQKALETAGYRTTMLDPAEPVKDYEAIIASADVVFPALHGLGGEDGTIQAWLEDHDVRYVGCDSQVSALCFDKWQYKQALLAAGIRVPRGELVDRAGFDASELRRSGFVLKPYDGGSSVDTYVARDPSSYDMTALYTSFDRHKQMLLEELIDGQELTAGVLHDEALPIIEIIPPSDGEFDYENKYNGKTRELCPPESLGAEVQKQAQELAVRIHQLVGAHDMSRTDMMVTPSGELYVLETNTIPGLTDQSLFPKAAAAAGYDMPMFVSRLVEAAQQR